MDKIVDLEKRLADKKKKEHVAQHRAKIEAVQKVVQCSSCRLRCAVCGFQLPGKGEAGHSSTFRGLIFCEGCRKEFEDFLSIRKGEKESDIFWHNKEWFNMWSAWLNYRKAMIAFMNSKEFKRVLEELDTQR